MTELAEGDSFHRSVCNRCGVEDLVGFGRTRVEQRPWRLVWQCGVCFAVAVRSVPRELGPPLVMMLDVPGGSRISKREVRVAEKMELDLFDELVRAEILSEA